MKPKDVIQRYRQLLTSSLSERCRKKLSITKAVAISLLCLNYALAFTDLFPKTYAFADGRFGSVIRIIYPAINKIEFEMISHGEIILFTKYFVFSVVKFIVIFAIIFYCVIVLYKEKIKKSNIKFNIKLYLIYNIIIIYGVTIIALLFSGSGYGVEIVRTRYRWVVGVPSWGELFFSRSDPFLLHHLGVD